MIGLYVRLVALLSIYLPILMVGPGTPPADSSLVRTPYVQNVTTNSAVIVWATNSEGSAEVHYGADDVLDQQSPAESRQVEDRTYHAATLDGLLPDKTYTYQVWLAGQEMTTPGTFRTATAGGTFSFAVTGDTRTASPESRAIAAGISAQHPAFILHAGDLTSRGTTAEHDSDVFAIYRQVLSYAPLYPAVGNHELGTNPPQPYLDAFHLPANGPPGMEERVYSFDWGNAHFVSLDAYLPFEPGSAQYAWLAADLAASKRPWKFVILHPAPYSSGGHGSDLAVRAALGPLFEQGGVDVVFAGHDHHYERTIPLVSEQEPGPGQRGVIYIVAGGGGSPLYPAGSSSWTAYSASVYSYVAADLQGCSLTLTAIDAAGRAFDTVTLDKCPFAWTQVNASGFAEHTGSYAEQEAFDLTVYKDQLYLGMEGRSCARIWRSKAGVSAPQSQADWEQVVSDGFDGATDCAITPPTTDNDHIDSLEPFGDFLYASTAVQSAEKRGTQVWRSTSGDAGTWVQVNRPGFGERNENFKDMIVYDGLLCGGTGNDDGAQVRCTDGVTPDPVDSRRLFWTQHNLSGFGDPANQKIWTSGVHGGALVFGVESRSEDGMGAQGSIWRTRNIHDPQAWEKIFSPMDIGIVAGVTRVDVVASFNGALYIGFTQPGVGAQVWRSTTGERGSWQPAVTDGFGSPTSDRFISDSAAVANAGLYVATYDKRVGTTVWHTAEGAVWTQINPSGFGSPTTFAAELTTFHGLLYAWTSDYAAGQGVWRGQTKP